MRFVSPDSSHEDHAKRAQARSSSLCEEIADWMKGSSSQVQLITGECWNGALPTTRRKEGEAGKECLWRCLKFMLAKFPNYELIDKEITPSTQNQKLGFIRFPRQKKCSTICLGNEPNRRRQDHQLSLQRYLAWPRHPQHTYGAARIPIIQSRYRQRMRRTLRGFLFASTMPRRRSELSSILQ